MKSKDTLCHCHMSDDKHPSYKASYKSLLSEMLKAPSAQHRIKSLRRFLTVNYKTPIRLPAKTEMEYNKVKQQPPC